MPSHPVRLDTVVDEVLEVMAPLAARRDQTLQVDVPPLEVLAKGELLHIALGNLADNAIRYSPKSSLIVIAAIADDKPLRLSVRDHGPGMSESDCALALQPFVRLHEGPEIGSGLGLTIVSRVARALGGELSLQAPREGTGLEATLLLPLRAGAAQGLAAERRSYAAAKRSRH